MVLSLFHGVDNILECILLVLICTQYMLSSSSLLITRQYRVLGKTGVYYPNQVLQHLCDDSTRNLSRIIRIRSLSSARLHEHWSTVPIPLDIK